MSEILVNTVDNQPIEVYWQDEVELQLDLNLMYIKSGQKEIQDYVDNVSKPEINSYIETESKPIVTEIVNTIAEPLVNEYIETETKPSIDEYFNDKKPEIENLVNQASNYANNSQTSAEASAASAAAALTSANNAKASETNAKTSETNALSSKNAAASSATAASGSANNAKIWAEGTDSQVQALGGTKSAKGWAEASTNLDYTNITNCITEIPQDIKLELVDGTLTLKAGSKIYVPNGAGVFDEVTIDSNKTVQTFGITGSVFVFMRQDGSDIYGNVLVSTVNSGTTPGSGLYYKTDTNEINTYNSGVLQDGKFSLPIAICTVNSGTVTSIDQVFNGFGYIGSTVFALPGVKGLIPNGRNTDGSLKNIEFETTSVLTFTRTWDTQTPQTWFIDKDLSMFIYDYYIESKEKPSKINTVWYNPSTNTTYRKGDSGDFVELPCIPISPVGTGGSIASFTPKTAFHALDYNDSSWLAAQAMPSNKWIDLTLGASGATYTAPANGWVVFAGIGQDSMHLANITNLIGYCAGNRPDGYISLSIPVINGNKFALYYGTAPTSNIRFRFIYAEGSK